MCLFFCMVKFPGRPPIDWPIEQAQGGAPEFLPHRVEHGGRAATSREGMGKSRLAHQGCLQGLLSEFRAAPPTPGGGHPHARSLFTNSLAVTT